MTDKIEVPRSILLAAHKQVTDAMKIWQQSIDADRLYEKRDQNWEKPKVWEDHITWMGNRFSLAKVTADSLAELLGGKSDD
jgi:hypothetical protein